VAFACFYKFSNSPKAALRFPTTPFLANFLIADKRESNRRVLFDWPRTGDKDIHESLRALLPVRAGSHVGDSNERPKQIEWLGPIVRLLIPIETTF
jgi:hypothetical protein